MREFSVMRRRGIVGGVWAAAVLMAAAAPAAGEDWPTWRHDGGRTASTAAELPAELALQWSRQLPRPKAAWPITQYMLQFDASYEPVVAGRRLFIASMVADSITAYDTETGEQLWRFYAEGPVRFAPTVWEGRVYAVSDDGRLYCLDAATGEPAWTFDGGPADRTILGNERLVSTRPARGAPVIRDGVVYFAAGVYPFMGVFIHALDARTGEVVWTNSASGAAYLLQPHSSPAFAGVGPQGYLVATDKHLIVPGGRSVPAWYDRAGGRFKFHWGNTKKGGYAVYAAGEWVINGGSFLELDSGGDRGRTEAAILTGEAMIGVDADGVITAQSLEIPVREETRTNKRGRKYIVRTGETRDLWSIDTAGMVDKLHLRAGGRLYGSKGAAVVAVEAPTRPAASMVPPPRARIAWRAEIDNDVWTMIAAADKLFVVSKAGMLYCFGATPSAPRTFAPEPPVETGETWRRRADAIVARTGCDAGYAVSLGVGSGELIEALARRSNLHIIAIDPDAAAVEAFRRRMDAAGLYGRRVAARVGDPFTFPLPPYLAGLIVSEQSWTAEAWGGRDPKALYRVLRPYGGVLCLKAEAGADAAFARWAEDADLPGADMARVGGDLLLRRRGPLAGAASWTHENGDVANTIFSPDDRVKAPLGLLWFGGPSHLDVLPRHGHGPSPQVAGGRLVIEGIGVISARDVYTGRTLWRRRIKDLNTFGMYYNESYVDDIYDRSYNQRHLPGANELGSNYVVTTDRVYLAAGDVCYVLDAPSGKTIARWTLPTPSHLDDTCRPNWGYVGVAGDLLIAGAEPYRLTADRADGSVTESWNARYGAGSRRLVVMNRRTGEVLWQRAAELTFRHNTIVAGGGKLFCIDGMSPGKMAMLRRRGVPVVGRGRVFALDLRSGREVWSTGEEAFGTWLGYSAEHDILLQAGSLAKDRAYDEVGEGLAAYRGATGDRLWRIDDSYFGPPILHHDKIIMQVQGNTKASTPARAYSLLTGEPLIRRHPLTGEAIPWRWVRFYGCNTAIASEHLLTFRSASAAYVDLDSGTGTTSLGGFKSGCTANLIAADGVLNAPDYTRTCTCSYQNQASLAMIHDPHVDAWCVNDVPPPAAPTAVRRVGLNLGAPGNRVGPDRVLWLETPSIAGPSPDPPTWVDGSESLRWFCRHSSAVAGPLAWVTASGVEGVRSLTVRPFLQPVEPPAADAPPRQAQGYAKNRGAPATWDRAAVVGRFDRPTPYRLRLFFAEPDAAMTVGGRVFDVAVQGRRVLEGFDILAAAGGPNRTVVREVDAEIVDDLRIDLTPIAGEPVLCGVELIIGDEPPAAGE